MRVLILILTILNLFSIFSIYGFYLSKGIDDLLGLHFCVNELFISEIKLLN